MNNFVEIPASIRSLARRKTVCGVGINDSNYVVAPRINGKIVFCPFYKVWSSMLGRAYSEKLHSRNPRYRDCSVAKEWHTFSVFRAWMETQDWEGKQLDKDILISGNKIYGPDTCIFVSGVINKLLCDRAGARGLYPQGVTFSAVRGLFQSSCSLKGRTVHIGFYNSVYQAELSYLIFKSDMIKRIACEPEAVSNANLQSSLIRHSKEFKRMANKLFTDNKLNDNVQS